MARNARKGFTIVELMIAIVIFSVGIMGVYALIQTSIEASGRARDEALVANLARERLELAHWLRDANWNMENAWSGTVFKDGSVEAKEALDSSLKDVSEFGSGYWTVENDFSDGKALRLRKVALASEAPADVARDAATRLSMDAQGRMVHAFGRSEGTFAATPWHAYVKVEPIAYPTANDPREALRVTAVLVREDKTPREWRAATILTNWKR